MTHPTSEIYSNTVEWQVSRIQRGLTLILASSGPLLESDTLVPCFSRCLYVFITPQRKALLFCKGTKNNVHHQNKTINTELVIRIIKCEVAPREGVRSATFIPEHVRGRFPWTAKGLAEHRPRWTPSGPQLLGHPSHCVTPILLGAEHTTYTTSSWQLTHKTSTPCKQDYMQSW